jgi:hypothetical protein
MAVASEVTNISYPGNASTSTEYPVTFPAQDGSFIKVGVKPETGAFAELPSWEFTVLPKEGGTFAVVTNPAIPETSTVVIWREQPLTQPTELPLAGRLPSTALEASLDRLTMQVQELAAEVNRCVRLDKSAGPQGNFPVTPDTLLGVDANGLWTSFGPTKVRELALLAAIDAGNPLATWATEGDRASTPPDFVGQIGAQRDDKSLWIGNSTTGGDWSPAFADLGDTKIVRTLAQFENALAAGGRMRIVSSLTLPESYDVTVPVDIEGAPGVVLTIASSSTYGFSVQASMRVRDIRITSGSRTAHRAFAIGGGRFVGDFILQRVTIDNVGNALCADGGPTSVIMPNIFIDDCTFTAIGAVGYTGGGGSGGDGAIAITWNLGHVTIQNCRFKDTYGNGIYVGQNGILAGGLDNSAVVPNAEACGQIFIHNNWIRDFDRNGIEVFGADWSVVSFNRIIGGTGVRGGAGISLSMAGSHTVCHGNIVRDYWGYGIEVVHSHNIVTSNLIDTCTHDRENTLLAMSVGGRDVTNDCVIANNIFRNIVNKTYAHVALNFASSTDCTVVGNKFYNVSIACQIQSGACDAITFMGNEHRFSNGASALGATLQWTFSAGASAGTKHVVLHNITRNQAGAAATAAQFYKFGNGSGGYYNFTSGQQVHGSAGFLEFGATSQNLVIP